MVVMMMAAMMMVVPAMMVMVVPAMMMMVAPMMVVVAPMMMMLHPLDQIVLGGGHVSRSARQRGCRSARKAQSQCQHCAAEQ
jgi:hypothetical protein